MKPVINPKAKILLVGEAPGTGDTVFPFTGWAGQELDHLLRDVGLSRLDVSLTYLFDERPPNDDLNSWAVSRRDAKELFAPGLQRTTIPCKKGIVDPRRVQPAFARLQAEIKDAAPNVIGALGNASLAALCGVSGITKLRGALHHYQCPDEDGAGQHTIKVIPTFSPGFVLRNYESRPAAVADFQKLRLEASSPETNLINRTIYLDPTKEDLEAWIETLSASRFLACDIETKARQITCMGFAPNEREAYVIPLWTPKGNYWDHEGEVLAYKAIKKICESDSTKIFQNGIYDIQYLMKYKIRVRNFSEDTMLLHHSLYPALPKSLDFLGSIYVNERAWKRWRLRGDEDYKKDE